ncbi:hypothetical protein FOWG_17802 [Fusarium oxysporum f. sp. lycopersici MN25]|nr:hypothetical protein FOWG_17802 [Fusarium oxysporum f. sp. lycopersici MN25]
MIIGVRDHSLESRRVPLGKIPAILIILFMTFIRPVIGIKVVPLIGVLLTPPVALFCGVEAIVGAVQALVVGSSFLRIAIFTNEVDFSSVFCTFFPSVRFSLFREHFNVFGQSISAFRGIYEDL